MGKISAQVHFIRKASEPVPEKLELVCQAHDLTTLKAAIENGANSVTIDYRGTSLGTHSGFSLTQDAALRKGIRYAHEHKARIVVSFPQLSSDAASWATSISLIRDASILSIDAIALSDPALMLYAAAHYPELAIHYLVPQSMINPGSIRHLKRNIPISRVILPPVVSMAQIKEISEVPGVDVELVGFGYGSSILASRTAFGTGHKTAHRRSMIDGKALGLATASSACCDAIERCATADEASNDHLFESPRSDEWNALRVLPQLAAIDVRALRVELKDHNPAKLARLTRVWREAIDECLHDSEHYIVRPAWLAELEHLASSA